MQKLFKTVDSKLKKLYRFLYNAIQKKALTIYTFGVAFSSKRLEEIHVKGHLEDKEAA